MFIQSLPNNPFVSRFIFHPQLYKRLVSMSIQKLSEENSKPLLISNRTLQSNNTEQNETNEFNEVVTSVMCVDMDHAGQHFTEDELAIYNLHREACEAKKRMYVDPASGYKVFTAYAHLQRRKCCGTACRHCPYGQINVKEPAMRKRFNSLFYV